MVDNMHDHGQDDRFPSRTHPRMGWYDYSTPGYYFVTICTKDKSCIFGAPEKLNNAGCIAHRTMVEIPAHFPGVAVDKFVVMPNHVHAILILKDGKTKLSTVVGQYKSAVTRCLREAGWSQQVWQTSFHDHVIRDQRGYERIWAYIDTNPIRWKDDCFYVE